VKEAEEAQVAALILSIEGFEKRVLSARSDNAVAKEKYHEAFAAFAVAHAELDTKKDKVVAERGRLEEKRKAHAKAQAAADAKKKAAEEAEASVAALELELSAMQEQEERLSKARNEPREAKNATAESLKKAEQDLELVRTRALASRLARGR